MRIAIYGAGSLGTILGAYLSEAGIQADLVSRNRAHVEALNRNGAHVVGFRDFTVPVNALTPDEMGGGYDVVFLMTKCIGNRETADFLRKKLSPQGIVCTCQNGLPEPGLEAVLGKGRVYGCTIGWGASYISPGVSELTSGEDTFTFTLGRTEGGSDGNLHLLASILSGMGKAEIDPDFMAARWSKLMINASFSAVSAAAGMTFGKAASSFRSRVIIQHILKECYDTAVALGIRPAPMQGKDVAFIASWSSFPKRVLSFLLIPLAMRRHRSLKSSMLQDIEKGKPTEIEAVDGAAAAEGRRAGIPTPYLDMTIRIVEDISAGRLIPLPSNLNLYESLRHKH